MLLWVTLSHFLSLYNTMRPPLDQNRAAHTRTAPARPRGMFGCTCRSADLLKEKSQLQKNEQMRAPHDGQKNIKKNAPITINFRASATTRNGVVFGVFLAVVVLSFAQFFGVGTSPPSKDQHSCTCCRTYPEGVRVRCVWAARFWSSGGLIVYRDKE